MAYIFRHHSRFADKYKKISKMISSVNDFVGYLNMVQLSDLKFEQNKVCSDIGLSVFATSIACCICINTKNVL